MNGPHPTSQHPNSKNLHHISITIFVTNFPTTVSSKDLWKLCDRQGVVADVYIAAYWGETVFVDEDADENIANGRFANRVPDFASLDNISQHDYESEASGNDQDIHSINESQEEGEINDKKEQMGYEMNAPGKSVDSFVRSEIIGETDEGCVKMYGKEIDDDILEDHFDGDRGNDTIEDNADVNPSTNVSLKVNIPEVANDSSIVSPSTPPGNDLNIAKESCY
ncbi:zinc finger CCCH domain-containing protein 19 [Tanacetum coccineum]